MSRLRTRTTTQGGGGAAARGHHRGLHRVARESCAKKVTWVRAKGGQKLSYFYPTHTHSYVFRLEVKALNQRRGRKYKSIRGALSASQHWGVACRTLPHSRHTLASGCQLRKSRSSSTVSSLSRIETMAASST